MIFEIVTFEIEPEDATALEAAVAKMLPLFAEARGGHGLTLMRSIDRPGQYQAVIGWDRIEDHVVHFCGSPEFETWKKEVGRFYRKPPIVEHFIVAISADKLS